MENQEERKGHSSGDNRNVYFEQYDNKSSGNMYIKNKFTLHNIVEESQVLYLLLDAIGVQTLLTRGTRNKIFCRHIRYIKSFLSTTTEYTC